MKITTTVKYASALMLAMIATGCASLHDENYAWCGTSCPVPVKASMPAAEPIVPPAPEAIVQPVPEPQMKRLTLMADALFKFDKSDLKDMLPAGKSKLDGLVQSVLNQEMTVNEILVTGHTDRLGSNAYNQRLSEARARTVANYLQSMGITTPIQVIGQGEAAPVTTDCKGNNRSKALIDCLSPDRRVTVDLIGTTTQK